MVMMEVYRLCHSERCPSWRRWTMKTLLSMNVNYYYYMTFFPSWYYYCCLKIRVQFSICPWALNWCYSWLIFWEGQVVGCGAPRWQEIDSSFWIYGWRFARIYESTSRSFQWFKSNQSKLSPSLTVPTVSHGKRFGVTIWFCSMFTVYLCMLMRGQVRNLLFLDFELSNRICKALSFTSFSDLFFSCYLWLSILCWRMRLVEILLPNL